MTRLKIENLKKTYHDANDLIVLDNLNLTVEQNEFIGIVGTSGCGKSTLLHIIGGVDKADSGRIFLDDNEISSYDYKKMASYRRKQVSIIYQFYNLLPVLNVVDNIILPLKLDNRKVDQQYLDELLQLLQLNDKKDAYPSELSGGQQQRVAIARSLITRPKLLLADEPTGNLDSENSKIVVDYLKKIHHQNDITIIMVTHDLELAKNCDRIYVLEQGKLREYET
ncbi:MAG TPA: ABC transporter ATP-binding protein [Candidatus Erysipelatoclostridium merdavium]|uniref:ABC transporter ATP-binding protein n=1 Tax=Candidatus Erysipelatoclostridium merdavium TaxID=2838566 RepID=A0A9D2BMC8_9FIRM|nr:ABC transporter ATP-binding protein [Candidatus Erysipelatoclostridium merdavium]